MQLTGTQFEALQDALLEAFDPASLEQAVRIGLDKNLAAIAGGTNFQEVTFNLIQWAERSGRVDDLLAAALQGNPSTPALLAFRAGYRPNAVAGSQNSMAPQQYNVAGDVYNVGQVTGTTIIIGRSAHADSSAGEKTDAASS